MTEEAHIRPDHEWEWDPIEHPPSHVHIGPLCYGEPAVVKRWGDKDE